MNETEAVIYVLEHSKEIRDRYEGEYDFTIKDVGLNITDAYDTGIDDMIIEDGITDKIIVEDEDDDDYAYYPFGTDLQQIRREIAKFKKIQNKENRIRKKIKDDQDKEYEDYRPKRERIRKLGYIKSQRFRDAIDFASPKACKERAIEKYVKNPTPENLQEMKILAKNDILPDQEWSILGWMVKNQSSESRAVRQVFFIERTGPRPREFSQGNY